MRNILIMLATVAAGVIGLIALVLFMIAYGIPPFQDVGIKFTFR